mmetsp:Transcript_8118/g.23288  ORF Transcript_8118/g.23288 Transcript_8118/m.23288 type:complete len:328 (+) Transcript_8118:589-1572(+)
MLAKYESRMRRAVTSAAQNPLAQHLRQVWNWARSPAAAQVSPGAGTLLSSALSIQVTSMAPLVAQLSRTTFTSAWNFSLASSHVHQKDSQAAERLKLLSFCGGGVYFWWQLGVAKYLRERYDLSRTRMLGASGGAIAATLTACGISAEQAIQAAKAMADDRGLLERPLGVVGLWGQQVRDWLNDVLPHEAAELCRERVELLVMDFPRFKERAIGGFTCRTDLTEVIMASAHVPWVLDYRFTTYCRGRLVIDGGLKDWLTGIRSKAIAVKGAVLIDHHTDKFLDSRSIDMSKPLSFAQLQKLIETGYDHGRRQEASGAFSHLDRLPCL